MLSISQRIRISDDEGLQVLSNIRPQLEALLNIRELLTYLRRSRAITDNEEEQFGLQSRAIVTSRDVAGTLINILKKKGTGMKPAELLLAALKDSVREESWPHLGHKELIELIEKQMEAAYNRGRPAVSA